MMTDTIFYTILAILAAAVAITIVFLNRRRAVGKLKRTIEERWGRPPIAGDCNSGSMQAISSYFDNYSEKRTGKFLIDGITWNDLDMDNVFKRINNTCSTVGEEYLYRLLRESVFDEAELKERERLIEHFRNNPGQRQKLQLYLARLGKRRFTGISDYFFNDKKDVSMRSLRYILQLAALLASPLVMIADVSAGIFMFIVIFIFNMTVYYKAKNDREVYMESLSYVVNLINYSKKIARDSSLRGIEEYAAALKKASDKIRSFGIKSFYQLFYQTGDIFLEPIKVIFFVELIAFESLLKKIFKYREEIRRLYETVGKLDAMISAASYRESLDYYAVPSFAEGRAALSFKDAYHPLIAKPVANSISLSDSILITGSNASGKSTFLKTAAINAILAQTIDTCLAREYRTGMFMIYTSMALKDSLSNNESYYIAEIKSLKRLFDNMNDKVPIFCMIDEVLRGTNTIERIAASSEVLQRLAGGNCLCVAATHDIELVSILKNRYGNYHFQESFLDNDIVFDYKIYPGKSTTRNAIKLLRLMGYSENVVASAEERAERFASEGKWQTI